MTDPFGLHPDRSWDVADTHAWALERLVEREVAMREAGRRYFDVSGRRVLDFTRPEPFSGRRMCSNCSGTLAEDERAYFPEALANAPVRVAALDAVVKPMIALGICGECAGEVWP